MAVHSTGSRMTSEVTPEYAYRVPAGGGKPWRLSWWPGRPLSEEQALAGMELDELVSDPALVTDPLAAALMQERAHRLGTVFAQALLLLAKAMAARGAVEIAPGEPADGPRGGDIGIPRRPREPGPGRGLEYLIDRCRPHTEPPVVFP
ncbi:hypothetical protein [Nocardia jiangsuensis]|uniref:Uncharacterized protein n=1 Tax=Nocardia jiangsuensis TaxID=1691563 RepID=A0ABV8DZW9_9NOCA